MLFGHVSKSPGSTALVGHKSPRISTKRFAEISSLRTSHHTKSQTLLCTTYAQNHAKSFKMARNGPHTQLLGPFIPVYLLFNKKCYRRATLIKNQKYHGVNNRTDHSICDGLYRHLFGTSLEGVLFQRHLCTLGLMAREGFYDGLGYVWKKF